LVYFPEHVACEDALSFFRYTSTNVTQLLELMGDKGTGDCDWMKFLLFTGHEGIEE
jgi:hypothetical protein